MRALIAFLFLNACSSLSYRSPGPYDGGALIGRGTYLVEVYLEPKQGGLQRFNAIFSQGQGQTLFNALAPSGKTLLRVRDLREESPEMKYFPTELGVSEAQARELYQKLRPLLFHDDRAVTERYPDGRPKRIGPLRVHEYDWDGHAFRLELEGSDFAARMSLREYAAGR